MVTATKVLMFQFNFKAVLFMTVEPYSLMQPLACQPQLCGVGCEGTLECDLWNEMMSVSTRRAQTECFDSAGLSQDQPTDKTVQVLATLKLY